jgi:hypothetical protein
MRVCSTQGAVSCRLGRAGQVVCPTSAYTGETDIRPGIRVALLLLLGVGDAGMREPLLLVTPAPPPPSALTGEACSEVGLGILEWPAACRHDTSASLPHLGKLLSAEQRRGQLPCAAPEPPDALGDCVGPEGILLGEGANALAAPRPLARRGGLRNMQDAQS